MCGVVGIIGPGSKEAAYETFLGLTTLQHRGQDAAGILTYDSSGFHLVKNHGLVESVFTRENMATLTGEMAVGHVRYSTTGRGDAIDIQPFLLSYPFGLGMVHNGNIVNYGQLSQTLRSQNRRHLLTHSDTEVILNLFAEGLAEYLTEYSNRPEIKSEFDTRLDRISWAVKKVYQHALGSYSIVTLIADQGLVAFRDPNGIRPLVWGRKGNSHMVASETVALTFLGYEVVRDLYPGEVLFIDSEGRAATRILKDTTPAQCMFEWVYFASPESVIESVPVYGARIQLGKNLAHSIQKEILEGKIQPDIIVPVPETSRIAAIALSEELRIPYREVLIKNRYIKRTFILDSQVKRQAAVRLKLSPVRSEIEGKRVLLVDDSIVRGTTSRKIIELVKKAGAKEVYFVSTCPPVRYPCYYGIDFPIPSELIASEKNLSEITADLGADAVIYQNGDGLTESIHSLRSLTSASPSQLQLCKACLNGCYPTSIEAKDHLVNSRQLHRKEAI